MRLLHFTAWFMVLLILPTGLIGGPTTVLCIGAGGHIAIEAGMEGSCKVTLLSLSDHDRPGGLSMGCDQGEKCCENCSDISIHIDDEALRQTFQQLDLVAPYPYLWNLLFALTTVVKAPPVVRLQPLALHFPSPPLESLRTIRLLI